MQKQQFVNFVKYLRETTEFDFIFKQVIFMLHPPFAMECYKNHRSLTLLDIENYQISEFEFRKNEKNATVKNHQGIFINIFY